MLLLPGCAAAPQLVAKLLVPCDLQYAEYVLCKVGIDLHVPWQTLQLLVLGVRLQVKCSGHACSAAQVYPKIAYLLTALHT